MQDALQRKGREGDDGFFSRKAGRRRDDTHTYHLRERKEDDGRLSPLTHPKRELFADDAVVFIAKWKGRWSLAV